MSSIEEQARTVFLAALERAPEQWPAFLDDACAGSAGLRARVDQLLKAHQALGAIHDGGAESPAVTMDQPAGENTGARIGPYKLLEQIGEGGFGVVFMAEQTQPVRRKVALKVLKPGMDTRQVVARFEAERQALAIMDHPNIAKIYDGGVTPSGRPYFVMELVKGVPITTFCDQNQLTPRERLELFVSACVAVQHAHQKGIIHRDLKPSNVLVTPPFSPSSVGGNTGGMVKIIDFGVAKALGQELTDKTLFTGFAQMIGTPLYMSPEQAGQSLDIDTRSDIYSLGVLLYELLTGSTPFPKKRFKEAAYDEIRRIIREEEPPKPSTRLSESKDSLASISASRHTEPAKLPKLVRGELDWIVMKALEKDRNRRYETANGFAMDIQRYLASEPVQACPPSARYRLRQFARKNRKLLMTGTAFTVLLLLATTVSSWQWWRAEQHADDARRAERDAQAQLFDSLLMQVHASRTSQHPGQRLDSLKTLAKATSLGRTLQRDPDDVLKLRNELIACLTLPDLQVETEWEGNSPGTNGVGFDAAFERYAWSFQGEGIRVRRLADHVEQFRLPTPPSDRVSRWVLLGFSPNGRYLAAYYVQWAEKHPLEVWDLGASAGRRIVDLPDVTALPAFAADGRSLVAPLPHGETAVLDLPTGRERRRLASGGPVEAVALHPDGKQLAAAGGRSDGVRVLNLETGAVAHRLPHPDTVQGLAWSADGKLLATACNDHRIHLWDAVSWHKQGELTGHRWEVGDVAFDSTGRWLASFGWDMTLRVWEVGSRRQVLNVEDIRVLSFRHRGGLAAAGLTGRRVQVWGFRPSEVFRELHPFETLSHPNTGFSPDGHWLITTNFAVDDLRIWDTGTYREIYSQPHPSQLGHLVGWCGEGAGLLSQEADGFYRVPMLAAPSRSEEPPALRFGHPRRLSGLKEDVRQQSRFPVGPEGRHLLVFDQRDAHALQSRVRLLELDRETIRVIWENWKLNPNSFAASKDGRLVAVGSYWGGSGITIWEAHTGRLVRELPIGDARMDFAPDGRRLYTTTGRLSPRGAECRSWWIGSWEPDRTLALKRTSHWPPDLRVAPDGTLALLFTMSDLRLLDPESLKELATLSAPEPGLLQGVEFSPDGRTLLTTTSGTVHLWDLGRLRQELAGLGLDWSTPSLRPAAAEFSSGST
jgi:serine/threonine protein kinase/WD40 repeat protein